MQIFVKLNTVGIDAGPFMVYSNLNNYQAPAYGPFTKTQLLAGVTINVPDVTTGIKIRSNGHCVNSILLTIPTTTSTTTTSTTTTTTCAPQNFIMQASGVTSITFSAFASTGPVKIIWATGVVDTWNVGNNVPTHTYPSAYTGDIIIQACDLSVIQTLSISSSNPNAILPTTATLTIKDTELTKLTGLKVANLYSSRTYVSANGGLVKSTTLLPNTLTEFWANQNNMTGDVVDLPAGLITFVCAGSNTLSGVVANIPSGIQFFEVLGANTIDGLIGDIPLTTQSFVVFGVNTIHGKLSDIPGNPATPTQSNTNPNLRSVNILGNNYIHGDLSDMNWRKMIVFNLGGKTNQPTPETTSFLSGNLDTLPVIQIADGGDGVHKFRTDLTVIGHSFGYSTISGNVNNFPDVFPFYSFQLGGENNGSTNTSYAGNPGLGYPPYPVGGWGITITGNISDVPHSGMITLALAGRNTITGNISTYLPAPRCDTFQILGNTTISGDAMNFPPIVRFVNVQGQSNINTYSGTRTWAGGLTPPFAATPYSMCRFILLSSILGNRLNNQTEINQLITDLNVNNLWENYGSIGAKVEIRSAFSPSGAAVAQLSALNTKITPPVLPGGLGATVIS